MESEHTTLTFPRHDGNAITAPWIKNNGITVAKAELLWQDAKGLVTAVGIEGDYMLLTVGKDAATQEGNALVAAKDGDGNIVWSWHIWVTKQTFAAADLATVITGGKDKYNYELKRAIYKLNPVNVGWVGERVSRGYNTYYQWGRKDPFFPTTGTGNTDHPVYNINNEAVTGLTCSTSAATIADNIKNPTTWYKFEKKPNTSTAYNLWDAQQTSNDDELDTPTKKTVYDPCPAGFCLPSTYLYFYFQLSANVRESTSWDGTGGACCPLLMCSTPPPVVGPSGKPGPARLGEPVTIGLLQPTMATQVAFSSSLRAPGGEAPENGRSLTPFGRSPKNDVFDERRRVQSHVHITPQRSPPSNHCPELGQWFVFSAPSRKKQIFLACVKK